MLLVYSSMKRQPLALIVLRRMHYNRTTPVPKWLHGIAFAAACQYTGVLYFTTSRYVYRNIYIFVERRYRDISDDILIKIN